MKSPFADCDAVLMHEKREVVFRGEGFTYTAWFYRCTETGIDFTTTELDDQNIGQVYEQYRKKYGIPTVEEIKATRKKYGISAAMMSKILGLGINQYRLYENGEIPSQSIGKLLGCIADVTVFKSFLNASKRQIGPKKYKLILENIESELQIPA